MSHPIENDAAGRDVHSPGQPGGGASGTRPGMHERALDTALAQMADAISTLQAPAPVRNRCVSEQRLRAAQSWCRPRPVGTGRSTSRARQRRLRLAVASAASLLVIAAICWATFSAPDVDPFARLHPAEPGSTAVLSSQGASQAGHPAPDEGTALEAASFVSLPYSDRSIANGTEATLEVSMPVSQLMAWGVPAPGDGPDDVVPVNLVLGADGLPLAVQVLPATDSTSTNIEELYP